MSEPVGIYSGTPGCGSQRTQELVESELEYKILCELPFHIANQDWEAVDKLTWLLSILRDR